MPTFYLIANKFKTESDGRVARDYWGNAKTTPLTIPLEAKTIGEAHDLAEEIDGEQGSEWLEWSVYSEAERMWKSGHTALFNLKEFEGVGRLKRGTL